MKPLTQEERLIIDKISGKQIKEINYENRKKDGIKYNVSGFEKSSTFRFFKEEDVKFAVELAKEMQSNCRKVIMMIIKRLNPDLLKALNNVLDEYDITIDQCFPVFQEQLEKEGKK